jgi:serine/threonine protein kinase
MVSHPECRRATLRDAMKRCDACGSVENERTSACVCGGTTFTPEPTETVDGRYEITEKIGRGSAGTVYRATDLGLGRDVAVKVISPMFASDAAMAERFQREARALATIESDHVVRIFTSGKHGRSLYFAMEFVPGVDIDTLIEGYVAHHEGFPVGRTLTIVRQVADGLAAAHARGLVHRDVKPGNVLVEDDTGRTVLVDFGLARRAAGATAKTIRAGTPHYMAPEQSSDVMVDAGALGPTTDVYALACMTFEMLTGQTPFVAEDVATLWQKHEAETAPLLSSLDRSLAPLDAVVARALEKAPARRWPGCPAFAEALRKAAQPLAPFGTASEPAVPRPERHVRGANRGIAPRVVVITPDRAALGAVIEAARIGSLHLDVHESASLASLEPPKAPTIIVLDARSLGAEPVAALARFRESSSASEAAVVVVGAKPADTWRLRAFGVREVIAEQSDDGALLDALRVIIGRHGWAVDRLG